MTKLILQKAERIKIRLVTIIQPVSNFFHETIYFVIQETFGRENPAGNFTKHVSLKLKWCCLEITPHLILRMNSKRFAVTLRGDIKSSRI